METPDFEELSRSSIHSAEEWECAWDIITVPEAWPALVNLVHDAMYTPQDAAIQLNCSMA